LNVNDLSYLAAAAGAVSSIAAVRWSSRQLNIQDKPLLRGLAAGTAILIGCLSYFLIGFALSLVRPAHQADIFIELRQGFGFGTKIITAATIATTTFYYYHSRRKPRPIDPPEAGVRERLLRARADIQQRIDGLQASPVLNYRGGIPERDLIIEGLREKLSEIDGALLKLAQTE